MHNGALPCYVNMYQSNRFNLHSCTLPNDSTNYSYVACTSVHLIKYANRASMSEYKQI